MDKRTRTKIPEGVNRVVNAVTGEESILVKRLEINRWIDINDQKPADEQNVIAVGTWWGEINGEGDEGYMGIGAWSGHSVSIDSDTYSTEIVNVTHWMPLPSHP